ncbi:MAG: glycosyltransferase family 39 protein [Candidatus Omnitrophota bacterium]
MSKGNTMNKSRFFNLIDSRGLLVAIVSLVALSIFYISLKKSFIGDEIEAVHTAWKIAHGERIYVDFIQHHHPFFYYFLAFLLPALKENWATIILLRIVMFLMSLGVGYTAYLIARKAFDKEIGIISLGFLGTTIIFSTVIIQIRPDIPQVLFAAISVLFLVRYLESKELRYLTANAISLGISFLFLQKAIIPLAATEIILFIDAVRRNIKYKILPLHILIFIATLIPYYFYLLLTNSLDTYFQLNWVLNMHFKAHFSPLKFLGKSFAMNNLVWTFWLIGVCFFLKNRIQKYLALFSLIIFAFMWASKCPSDQYFLLLVILVCILAANGLYSALGRSRALSAIVLLLGSLPLAYSIANLEYNDNDIKKASYVLAITKPGDYVYDGQNSFNLFREDIDYVWFGVGPNNVLDTYKRINKGYDYNIYRAIAEYKPRVISAYNIEDMNNPAIAGYYTKDNTYSELYIRKK